MQKSMFIIHTPYQLLTAINIISNFDIDDAVIILAHPTMDKYASLFNNTKTQVIIADKMYDKTYQLNMLLMHLIIFLRIIKKKMLVKELLADINKVGELYIPSDEPSIRVIYHYLLKRNHNLKLMLIDEGIGTYSGIICREKNILSKIAYKILRVAHVYENIDTIYCYHPELLNLNKNIKVQQIYFYKNNLIKLSRFFTKQILKYIGAKVIFLDQGIANFPQIKFALKILLNYFDKNEIIIKKHPRIDSDDMLYSEYKIINDGLPFELLLSLLDLTKVLIISFSSSATINPYLIMNERPFVLLLHKLCVDHEKTNGDTYFKEINLTQVELFFNKINTRIGYEYIYQPECMDQYIAFLRRIHQSVTKIAIKNGEEI